MPTDPLLSRSASQRLSLRISAVAVTIQRLSNAVEYAASCIWYRSIPPDAGREYTAKQMAAKWDARKAPREAFADSLESLDDDD